jgi:signal transduction histidine kinase
MAVLAAAPLVVRETHGPTASVWREVVGGAPIAFVLAVVAGIVAERFARQLRLLRADPPTARLPHWTGKEMRALAQTLEALHVRVRMADEVAEKHRRAAQTASAGMFELLSGLVAAEEGARGQLAAELHDTVAQSLMAARALIADGGDADSALAELVSEAEEQVRAVMARTRPPALRDGDLARAIAGLRDDLANRYGLRVAVSWPDEAYPLPLVTAVTVYRFFQEALLNVVKHADVDDARADLWVDDDFVVAVVSDDGPGFDPAEVRSERGRHVGLGLLRERARLVGGSLDVASWPALGTTLTLRLPRAASAGQAAQREAPALRRRRPAGIATTPGGVGGKPAA